MKIGFIFVLYKTSHQEIERLKKEVKSLKLKDFQIYFIDNSDNQQGYAAGVNAGLKKAIKDRCKLFVIGNPDKSFDLLDTMDQLVAFKHFDIFGFAMKQQGKTYYGGQIDKWRMSGGLVETSPQIGRAHV